MPKEKMDIRKLEDAPMTTYVKERIEFIDYHHPLTYSRSRSRNVFFKRLVFAKVIRGMSKLGSATVHAHVMTIARRIPNGLSPLHETWFHDIENQRNALTKIINRIWECAHQDNKMPELSAVHKLAWSMYEAEYRGANFIEQAVFIRLMSETDYPFLQSSETAIRKTLLDWLDEENVPDFLTIDRRKSNFSVSEIASLNRGDWGPYVALLSKKSIRKLLKENPDYLWAW